ncbi:AAA family ATPase [Actinoplanes oblitus]|uniref:AAA family ATPase n=1 Tax=Actinoplanes oblitus TaxID=3040509 RepID=A0ABY8W5M0_9ACTN|nr:AAA family ATPase [Actinoplanes oblitus]WIM93144.1 AAA family ATPase [Actinoplanes oblitus]
MPGVADPWTLAVHAAETGTAPLGTAVAISARRALTCAHVVLGQGAPLDALWVSFPKVGSAWRTRRRVRRVVHDAGDHEIADVAVLHFAEDLPVVPARLKRPAPEALAGLRWWAFGFPVTSRLHGNEASGRVGAQLGYGCVRLDTDSPYPVEQGFSGAGLWVPDYQAVVGIVGRALARGDRRGDAQALTVAQIDAFLPDERLRVLADWSAPESEPWNRQLAVRPGHVRETHAEQGRGEEGHATGGESGGGGGRESAWESDGWGSDWESGRQGAGGREIRDPEDRSRANREGWRLADDREAGRHWRPRSRGVTTEAEPGHRFRGRETALRRIVGWLDRPASDHRVLVVTGSPGAGKSAVLARVVTTADAGYRAELPADDRAVAATVGSVGCAVHAKGKTALEVAREIARAVSAPLPDEVDDLVTALAPGTERFNLVIDAVDEASSPAEARAILARIALPLVQHTTGVQVVLGTRRHDPEGDLLGRLGAAAEIIDLDDRDHFAFADLRDYTLATLRRPGNPYAASPVTELVADRIARLADGNFLVAGLEARMRVLYDTRPADPATIRLSAGVDDALHSYLARLPAVGGTPARTLLAALAYAEAPGWSATLWQVAVESLGGRVSEPVLDRFARSAAANFLVETSAAGEEPTFRLFHQALNDALLRDRGAGVALDERQLTRAFLAHGRAVGWANAPRYLLRSLPGHAQRAGLVDDLVADDGYLLHADLLRLIPATTAAGPARARMLRLTPQAISAGPAERAAMFSVTQAFEGTPPGFAGQPAPYRGRWATVPRRIERMSFEGHTDQVNDVCLLAVDGRSVLATASHDRTVRLWDPATGTEEQRLHGHTGAVTALCPVTLDGRNLLATVADDGTVRISDPLTGTQQRVFSARTAAVKAIRALTVDGDQRLAVAGDDGVLRTFDPMTGDERTRCTGHSGTIKALCLIGDRLATACEDRTVRIWDPATGAELLRLTGHTAAVNDVCPVGHLLATVSNDRTVRLWDPATGRERRCLRGHDSPVNGVCAVTLGAETLLATTDDHGAIRLWDPATGTLRHGFRGHVGWTRRIRAVLLDGETLLVTAGLDGTARLWDPLIADEQRRRGDRVDVILPIAGVAVTAGASGAVRVWDPATGAERDEPDQHVGRVTAICLIAVDGRSLLAVAMADRTVHFHDPLTGECRHRLARHTGGVGAACEIRLGGRVLLATGENDGTVRLWDPLTGACRHRWKRHTGRISALCPIEAGGETLLATAGHGRVGVWDPGTGEARGDQRRLRTLGWVNALRPIPVEGRAMLLSGGFQIARISDPVSGAEIRRFEGHAGVVSDVCPVRLGDRLAVVTVGEDRTARVFDVADGRCLVTIPLHHLGLTCAWVDGLLLIGLDTGLLAIDLDPFAVDQSRLPAWT